MYLNNYTITDHIITPEEGSVICYCKAVGGVTNGYVAYSNDTTAASILDIGWCATLPSNGSYIVQDNQDLTALPTNASIPFEEDGYVVVAATNKNNICIHPRWSGTHDEEFEAYVAPSTIALPT